MIVTLITNNKIHSITIPDKPRGQYWLKESYSKGSSKIIGIEALNDKWILKSNKKVAVIDNNGIPIRNVILNPLKVYNLCINSEQNDRICLFTEPITDDRQLYTKYIIEDNCELNIGRNEKNDIIISNQFVSGSHACLIYQDLRWSIIDNDSTNGTFVNGLRVKNHQLIIGDIIYIMGFKIIIGGSFIALNNPDGKVVCIANILHPFISQKFNKSESQDDDDSDSPRDKFFYRSPRFKRDITKSTIKIDSPPQNSEGEELPFMLVVGPSMTMGLASLATATFAINNAIANGNISAATPSVVMSSSMLLGTVLWPILAKRFEKDRKRKKELLRQEKYKEYLHRITSKFEEECKIQENILRENFVTISDCVNRIENQQRNLWERGFGQNDFLTLRVGLGSGLLSVEVSYSERKFTLDEDNLQEELYSICENPKVLKNIPITLSLFDKYISGIIGERHITKEFVKGLIFQLTSLYSYDEVKLVFIYDIIDEEDFGFSKWIPHVWSNDKKFRFIATNSNESKEVSAYIEREIENRSALNESELDDAFPYYVIFVFSKTMADRAEMLKQIYAKKINLHFSVINVYDELKNLPKECSMVVELEKNSGKLFDKNDISGQTVSFVPDIYLPVNPEELSIKLSNVQLDIIEGSFKLPKMITFLEMFGVGKVEHLNALSRWNENDPTKSLEAAIGVDTMGELFRLDLHEKFHGPHGLVAGMTGSGKSEFIITYILSLAVNYHPNEVAFILIDYKGGGMAKSFENLPHTAGIITNLDGAAIKRSLISIESELKRRQAIFAKASKDVGVSNIDIYKYQRLFREGSVKEPLQHLFIISDEFAELKTQQPDFMTQLVSAARIGRSLGIHLILATQKPSGVVDDQIWSNSKFRVCLKVQERADSMDMLKRPDAAELTDTGRFYLQVGYNELFEMGQSSWAGAPYYPSDKVIIEKDSSIAVIDRNGRVIKSAMLDNRKNIISNPKKQLDVITDYLKNISDEEKIKVRPLWLEPMPAIILLDEIRNKYSYIKAKPFVLNPVLGEYDDPARQQQCILKIPISEEGNILIYGISGSGKTTFLNTLIYSILTNHTPDEVNIYLMDFATETLRAFSKAPHVGDVILAFESEKISNLFKMLKTEMEIRRKLFADFGGDYNSYISNSETKVPSILVMINNYSAFTEMYEEKEEAISYLTREGTRYGIYFVLTVIGSGAIRFRILQNFKQHFVLQMNDESDYGTILGKTDGLFPSKHKGRGLVKTDNLYEFQIANITNDAVPYKYIRNECNRINISWTGNTAVKIPILPDIVDVKFLDEYIDSKNPLNIPIGVEKNSLKIYTYPFGQSYINMILSSGSESQLFINDLTAFLDEKYNFDITFIDSSQSFLDYNSNKMMYVSNTKDIETVVDELFDLVLYRNNAYKDSIQSGIPYEPFTYKIVIVNSVIELKNNLSDESREKFELILEKGEIKYSVVIIFAEQIKNVSSISFDKWYKLHLGTSDGIWVGNGIADQYHIKPAKITSEMNEEVPFGFGYCIQKGKAVKVKLLCSKMEDVQDE